MVGYQEVLLDDDDYAKLKDKKWHIKDNGYAYTKVYGKRLTTMYMHHFVHGRFTDGRVTHHINGNKLDNQKENLVAVSESVNISARNLRKDSKTGYKGVHLLTVGNRWSAQIKHRGETFYLGCFSSPENAALAYNKVAKRFLGDLAYINDVPETHANILLGSRV